MSKFDDIRYRIGILITGHEYDYFDDFITSCETTEKDIKEFIELYLRDIRGLNIDRNRFSELRFKLLKVGEKE